MKKRILALALAGTTAFSVFGGLNVFAALPESAEDPFESYTAVKVVESGDYLVDANGKLAGIDGNIDSAKEVQILWDALNADDTSEVIVENSVYLYDYKKAEDKTGALKKALDAAFAAAAGEKATDTEFKALADAWTAYYTWGAEAYQGNASTRDGVINTFNNNKKKFDELKKADYDAEAWLEYDMDELKAEFAKANTGTWATSSLVYLNQQFEARLAVLTAADQSENMEKYERLLEVFESLEPSDYDKYDWNTMAKLVDDAADKYEDGKYGAAVALLEEALAIAPEAGDYSDLKDVLMGMYQDKDGKTKSSYIVEKYDGAKNAIYKASDYKAATGGYTMAWKDLVSYDFDYDYDLDGEAETFRGVYDFAYTVYTDAKKINGKVAQSRIDFAVQVLTEAIEALDPTSSVSDWTMLRLESWIELGRSYDEEDFNTYSRAWKNFIADLEKAEEVVAKANPSKSELTAALSALEAEFETVSNAAKTPSATLSAEYRTVVREAQKLVDDALTEEVTTPQYIALKKAIEDASKNATYFDLDEETSKVLSSDLTENIEALKAAMELYNHPQGWYKVDDTWYYGVGAENYTGWLELNGRTYFLKDDGSMAASTWVKTEAGYWYYLNASGAMLHDGWAKINDTWYFFKNFGGMAEGWVKDGNTWYYLTPGSGAMVSNGWSLINGKYYYFTESGAMLANTTTPDGYKVDASGAWVK